MKEAEGGVEERAEDRQFVTPQVEKRRHRRVKLATQVKCAAMGRDDVFLTRDVSAGGMFVTAQSPLPIGAEVGLTFSLGTGVPALACTGKVVYSQQGMGMGIEFFGLNEDCALTLQKFVDESN
jgi:hypothetical protein